MSARERFLPDRGSVLRRSVVLFVLAVAALAGCEEGGVIGQEVPNTPPDTQVEGTPPNLAEASFRIEFFWSGSDRDGSVAYFEWIITDNGEDGIFSPADTVGAWNRTTAFDSTFMVVADIPDFETDVDNEQIHDPKHVRFWRTHSFFVRAVDDDGQADPTPASVSFTATTVAPLVKIVQPANTEPSTCLEGPMAPWFRWEYKDPDDPEKLPGWIRWTFMEWTGDECLTDERYARLDPFADLEEDDWTPWIHTEAAGDSGLSKRFPVLEGGPGKMYLFALQARDVSGAVSPLLEWGRNVFHIKTTDTKYPVLSLRERNLGAVTAVSRGSIRRYDIVAGQPIDLRWSGDASSYGGVVEEYRYGFNVIDPSNEDDPNWAVPWGPNWARAHRPGGFAQGSPNLVVQARDNSGGLTRIVYDFNVIRAKSRRDQRPLLLIDDSNETQNPVIDAYFDDLWRVMLGPVREYSSAADVLDVQRDRTRLGFSAINDYRSIIWLVSSDPQTFFATELAPRGASDFPFNWLEVYQKLVGNVMLVGPAVMRNSVQQDSRFNPIYPIVMNLSYGFADYDAGVSLGRSPDADGRIVNTGSLRYPYTSWCLEAIDQADPVNVGRRNNDRGRDLRCDSYTYARVSPEYVDRYRPSPARINALHPLQVRRNAGVTRDVHELAMFSELSMPYEEFYNRNAAGRNVVLTLRDCQTPMYEAVARMDVDDEAIMAPFDRDPAYHLETQDRLVDVRETPGGEEYEACPAVTVDRRPTSTVTGAPVVIASTQWSETKQNGTVPFEDYLWGFNPLSFRRAEVQDAVQWILIDRWRLNEQ